MIKVLNIASFIPIKELELDNDISLKIYSDLSKTYAIKSEFVKPVSNIPKWAAFIKKSLKIRREIFSRKDYFDTKYNLKIHFYRDTLPFINKLPFNTDFLLPLQYKIYKKFLKDLIISYQPDLIHSHSICPDSYYAMELFREFNIPYILTIRGSRSGFYFSKQGQEILRNASAITSPDHRVFLSLKQEFPIELIPHGIDDFWYNENKKIFNSDKYRLVTVSRLLEMKNIQIVLKAVARLLQEGYQVTYDIIGDGYFRENLTSLAEELSIMKNVRFHGFQDAEYIRDIYKDTDIFVMLSYPETFGRSYFEASAQGLYIIGVKNTGAYGHLTDSEAIFIDIDELQLVEAIKSINSDEFYLKTSRAGIKVNELRNSMIIEKYYKIISRVIASDQNSHQTYYE